MADNRQLKLEKKMRKLVSDVAKNMPIDKLQELLPIFVDLLVRINNKPSHSQFYLDDLERDFNKELKKLKKS